MRKQRRIPPVWHQRKRKRVADVLKYTKLRGARPKHVRGAARYAGSLQPTGRQDLLRRGARGSSRSARAASGRGWPAAAAVPAPSSPPAPRGAGSERYCAAAPSTLEGTACENARLWAAAFRCAAGPALAAESQASVEFQPRAEALLPQAGEVAPQAPHAHQAPCGA